MLRGPLLLCLLGAPLLDAHLLVIKDAGLGAAAGQPTRAPGMLWSRGGVLRAEGGQYSVKVNC